MFLQLLFISILMIFSSCCRNSACDFASNPALIKLAQDAYAEDYAKYLKYKESLETPNKDNSLDAFITQFQQSFNELNQEYEITLKIIYKDEKKFIYERVLNYDASKDIPLEHEICVVFLSDLGMHSLGFVRRCNQMSDSEKSAWIESLKNQVYLTSF